MKYIAIVFGLLISQQSSALVFGEINVLSAYNYPLDAKIPIAESYPGELDTVKIMMAGKHSFLGSGKVWVPILDDVLLNIQFNEEDRAYIHLTSSSPIQELFMEFIIDIVSENKLFSKEYIVLIDPQNYPHHPKLTKQGVKPTKKEVTKMESHDMESELGKTSQGMESHGMESELGKTSQGMESTEP